LLRLVLCCFDKLLHSADEELQVTRQFQCSSDPQQLTNKKACSMRFSIANLLLHA